MQSSARESSTAHHLFLDFSLPRLAGTLSSSPKKRQGILSVLYSFAGDGDQGHLHAIKRLEEVMSDMDTYIHVLANLLHLEDELSDELVDIYLYYSTIGLAQPTPTTRAAAIGMLPLLLVHNDESLAGLLPTLIKLAMEDEWWEVQAQLLVVSTSIIQALEEKDALGNQLGGVLSIVETSLNSEAPLAVQKIGLTVLAPILHLSHGELSSNDIFLARLFVNVLVGLPVDERCAMLGMHGGNDRDRSRSARESDPTADTEGNGNLLQIESQTGGTIQLNPLPMAWDGLAVASALCQKVTEGSLERMDLGHLQVLAACVQGECNIDINQAIDTGGGGWGDQDDDSNGESGPKLGQEWGYIFEQLRDYIFVALCDRDSVRLTLGVLRSFLKNSQLGEGVLREGRFLGTLRLLYPEDKDKGDEICQEAVEAFLFEVRKWGEPFTSVVMSTLSQFEDQGGGQILQGLVPCSVDSDVP